jgi:hypothetical protein
VGVRFDLEGFGNLGAKQRSMTSFACLWRFSFSGIRSRALSVFRAPEPFKPNGDVQVTGL